GCWIGYAGLNIGLPAMTIKLAAGEETAPYFSCYFALCNLFLAIGTFLGGLMLDHYSEVTFSLGSWSFSFVVALFGVCGVLRMLVLWALPKVR
ncbi:MAG: hypothetical protein MPJ24_10580, partial [Pirellulaceae bacterium]|nr:hypothetical protein [Pirellulaceae bacterium]